MKKTILILEEDKALCSIIKEFLEEYLNLSVICASDIEEAFDLLEVNKIDVFIVGTSPYNEAQVGGLIHLAKSWHQAKTIVLTSSKNLNEVVKKLEAHVALPKPFNWDDLVALL